MGCSDKWMSKLMIAKTLCVLVHRVKQSIQALEICRKAKRNGVYDINHNGGSIVMANFLPSTTGSNITLTLNNHINALSNHVS